MKIFFLQTPEIARPRSIPAAGAASPTTATGAAQPVDDDLEIEAVLSAEGLLKHKYEVAEREGRVVEISSGDEGEEEGDGGDAAPSGTGPALLPPSQASQEGGSQDSSSSKRKSRNPFEAAEGSEYKAMLHHSIMSQRLSQFFEHNSFSPILC
ncbi:MAG: hypothetical protein Q8P67_24150, partial [archaeon]|nr:hypothetical protein [archaeon]